MCAEGLYSGLGSIGSAAIGAWAANHSAYKQFKYQSALQKQAAKLNYKYGLKSLENSPASSRKGLETAGYNPMLAVQNATSGANSGWTSSGQATAPDYSQAISNALDFKRLENETKQTEAATNLQNEQAQTEQSKRENLSFQNSMLDVEKHLKDKDLSTYDERFYNEMYRMMQESEKLRQEASVVGYNAESQRIVADAAKTNAEVNQEWTPGKIVAGAITGLGVGALTAFGPGKFLKGAKAAANAGKTVKAAANAGKTVKHSKQVSSVIPHLHSFGKTRSH